MKRIKFCFLIIYGGVLLTTNSLNVHRLFAEEPNKPEIQAPAETSLTLSECYELARRQSETLKMKQEEINQAAARKRQALGTALPNIDWLSATTIQDSNPSAAGSSGGATSTSLRRRITQNEFTLHQSLFSGFRDLSAIKGAAADTRRLTNEYQRDVMTLLESVATNFYEVIFNETDFKDIDSLVQQTEGRIKELRDRVRLGRSRQSEVMTAESELAILRAQAVSVHGTILTTREQLSYLMGRDITGTPLLDQMGIPPLLSKEDAILKAKDRSDIQALRDQLEVNKYLVRIARADHWPELNFTGDYYTHREGILHGVDWDMIFSADIPIYHGGTTQAKVEEAYSAWREVQFQLEQLERSVRSDVQVSLTTLQTTRDQAVALEDAYKKAANSYNAQVKEYRLGLVNNLDVLAASNSMLTAKENWDRALIQSKLQYIHLNAVIENFPELKQIKN